MAIVYYDFQGGNGSGASPANTRNSFTTPSDNDVLRFKRGSVWNTNSQSNFGTAINLTIEAYANADGTDNPFLPRPVIINTQVASTNTWNFQGNGIHTIRNIEFNGCFSNTNGGIIGLGPVAADGGKFASANINNCVFTNIIANAIRSGGSDTTASRTIIIKNCVFNMIGEDAFYGCADLFEFSYNTVTNVSVYTVTGDGVGFLGCNPTFAWVHNNYIDHSSRPYKHCIIIDTTTPGSGFSVIEYNTLIGSIGNNTDNSTIINMESAGIIQKNTIYSGRVAVNLTGNGSTVRSNVIIVKESTADAPVLAIDALNCNIINNTFIGKGENISPFVQTAALRTGAFIANNIAVNNGNFYTRGTSASETIQNNAFENISVKYTAGSSTGDIDTILNLQSNYSLNVNSAVKYLGAHLGYITDRSGNMFNNPPSIGAYEYITPRTVSVNRGVR